MKRTLKKLCSIVLTITFIMGILAGCTSNDSKPSNESTTPQKQEEQQGNTNTKEDTSNETDSSPYPVVDEPLTLTYYAEIGFKAANIMKSWGEIEAFKELEKITGIHLEFIHPPVGQEKEQFNLIVASNDLPDLMQYDWRNSYPGGPNKALQDGIIIELNDLIAENAPNFTKIMEENPEWRKQSVTDEGTYYMVPFIRGDDLNRTINGYQIRKDWLDKLGLNVPTNLDEWYTVLKAFKEGDPNGNGQADEIPLISQKGNGIYDFLLAYGLTKEDNGFFVDNGQVKYSYMEPAYKDYLTVMRKWYEEGLIDPEYPAVDRATLDAKMTSDIAGVAFGGAGTGFMGLFMNIMRQEKNKPEFTLVGAPYPKTADGKMYGIKDDFVPGGGIAITNANKYPAESVRMLDYCYSDEGYLLMNFGPEGKGYKMVNGEVQFTDYVMKNPDGLTFDLALLKCGMAPWTGPFVQAGLYWATAVSVYPEPREALDIWQPASTDIALPPITPSVDESQRLASILNEINTYASEMRDKFIMGLEPIENFDEYINTLKNMGIEEALKIEQAAFDRYNQR